MLNNKKGALFVILAFLCGPLNVSATEKALSPSSVISGQIQHNGLTAEQARELLIMVLKHENLFIDKPGFNIEHIEFVPGYANFHVTWDSPEAAATDVIGEFAVSPRTGDVWESNNCKQYSFPELKRLQAEVMKRTGWTFSGELKEREGLGCN